MQVRGTQSVVDCLLEYGSKHKASLIVMGSQQVTKGDAALASSISLAILKRTEAPVLITKPSTPAPLGCLSGGLRAMLAVEHTARPLLKWLNAHLITVSRGDKLYLARVGAKDAKGQVQQLDMLFMAASCILCPFVDCMLGATGIVSVNP